MGSHICTTDSLMAGAPIMEMWCPICTNTAPNELGYIGMRCSVCGAVSNMEDTWPDIVRMRRQKLALSRKQIGVLLGYTRATVKHYEFVRCTKPYIAATERLMKEKYPVPEKSA